MPQTGDVLGTLRAEAAYLTDHLQHCVRDYGADTTMTDAAVMRIVELRRICGLLAGRDLHARSVAAYEIDPQGDPETWLPEVEWTALAAALNG